MDISSLVSVFVVGMTGVAGLGKALFDRGLSKEARDRVEVAEQEAFKAVPQSPGFRLIDPNAIHGRDATDPQAEDVAHGSDSSRNTIPSTSLFNLYSKQTESYQLQTQSRATWSFIFALVAMFAGLGLVIWGGSQIIAGGGWEHVAAGSIITVTGAAVGAYITKTFLDVHRLSLLQLNHYFRQPVLNTNILMAQRLADQLPDEAKQKAYVEIISKIAALISAEPVRNEDITSLLDPVDSPPTTKNKPKKQIPPPKKSVVSDE